VLGFTIESQLYEAMKHHGSLITQLSKERVLDELRKFFKGSSFKLARQTYEALALPGLPTKLIAKEQLSIIEHMAIASLLQGYDASVWPWTKEEKALLQKLVLLQQGVPSDVELYRMTDVESMINVGAVVFGWDAEQLTTRWHRLAIHHRKELDVNGHDIIALGYEGPKVEAIFMAIEEAVLRHQLANKKERIIEWMKEKFDEHQ
jgi:tRNA nucleotidyltransferase/poly(A) polymerase